MAALIKISNSKHHSYKVKPSKGAGKENATEKVAYK